jgi:hypothetical protein
MKSLGNDLDHCCDEWSETSPCHLRHAELVSASMAGTVILRGAKGNGRLGTLTQVQGDEIRGAAFRAMAAVS